MSQFDRSSLLKFLRKPRCLREIIRHFQVPTRLLDYHLREAVKSGDALVYRKQILPGFLVSNAKQVRLKEPLYISRNSPLLVKDLVAINSLPKTGSPGTEELVRHNHKSSGLSPKKLVFIHALTAYLKLGKTDLSGIFHNLSTKMKLAKRNRSIRKLEWKKAYNSSESKSLLHAERICLFRALSNQPLPFLDIHERFGISKRMVVGFMKRGFFEEVWGPRNIGVKFKLTEKGEAYLKRLEKASRFKNRQLKKISIRLKHRITT